MSSARIGFIVAAVAIAVGAAGCSGSSSSSQEDLPESVRGTDDVRAPSDPRPEKLGGSESDEFEPEDIEAAESASEEVQDYCSGAVSEAQYEGCLSHVEEVP